MKTEFCQVRAILNFILIGQKDSNFMAHWYLEYAIFSII